MIIINDLHLPLDMPRLESVAARELKISTEQIKSVRLFRRSVDARKKSDVHFCCSLLVSVYGNENNIIKRSKKAKMFSEDNYVWPENAQKRAYRPVVVGFGPAGMFAALTLARAGLCPLVLERGEEVDGRQKSIESFFAGGSLNPESNVQFGEGGAGTFSDGKLNTGIKNIRCRAVLKEFVRFGADEKILIDAKPHVGTDKLTEVVKNLRQEVISLGGEVRFSCRVDEVLTENGAVCGVLLNGGEKIACDRLILATGHSARDTFFMLKNKGISMERKPFSVGARIEHKREDIDRALYGDFAGHSTLGAADYKLAAHLKDGRGVYTFCMCPGGVVVNASSEEGKIAVNGMSYSRRDGENSNSAVLADIRPDELPGDDVLAGINLQREIESRAFSIGGGAVPTQTVGSLYGENSTDSYVTPSVKPNTVKSDIFEVLPESIAESLKEGIRIFGTKIKGFDDGRAVLTFPETRSSSPVRILRDDLLESVSLKGLYPCGEGAGYAGGIMSAAVDGIKCAEAVINS